jgi:DNA primase
VSTPLSWDEVDDTLNPAAHTIKTVPLRLAARGDPMKPVLTQTLDVPALLTALAKKLTG